MTECEAKLLASLARVETVVGEVKEDLDQHRKDHAEMDKRVREVETKVSNWSFLVGALVTLVTIFAALMAVSGCAVAVQRPRHLDVNMQQSAVVAITDDLGDTHCTGFRVPQGIITAGHCVHDGEYIAYIGEAQDYNADTGGFNNVRPVGIIRRVAGYDVVLLSSRPGQLVPLGSRMPNVGEDIYTIGHPYGHPYNMTRGYISSPVPLQEWGDTFMVAYLPVSPGNSGGPVYDSEGFVIGLVSAMGGSLTMITPLEALQEVIHG